MAYGACHRCGCAFEECECTVSTGISGTGAGVSVTGRLRGRAKPQDPRRREPVSSELVFAHVDFAGFEFRSLVVALEEVANCSSKKGVTEAGEEAEDAGGTDADKPPAKSA